MEAERREQTIISRPKREKKSPDLALVPPQESAISRPEKIHTTDQHASEELPLSERTRSIEGLLFATPHLDEVLYLCDIANDDVESMLRSMDPTVFASTRDNLAEAEKELTALKLELNRHVKQEAEHVTIPKGYKNVNAQKDRIERIREIAEKVDAEYRLRDKYHVDPERILTSPELLNALSANTEDVAHLDVWLRQSMKTADERLEDLEQERKEQHRGKKNVSPDAIVAEQQRVALQREHYIKEYFENLLRINKATPRYRPREYQPPTRPPQPTKKTFDDPIPSQKSAISKRESITIAENDKTLVRSVMPSELPPRSESQSEIAKPDLYRRWQDFIDEQYLRNGAYPDPDRMRELAPTVVDIILTEAREQSPEPWRMIEWIEDTIDFGKQQIPTESKALASLHAVFDEAMAQAIQAIKNDTPVVPEVGFEEN